MRLRILIVLLLLGFAAVSQNTLLLEKIGTNRKFYFKPGDSFMLRTSKPDTLFKGNIWSIGPRDITIQSYLPLTVKYDNIKYVYIHHRFARQFGKYTCIFAGVTFGVITINHLLNHEQVFTPDLAYLTLPFLGVGLISLSLDREKMKIGPKWKLKVLDMPVFH